MLCCFVRNMEQWKKIPGWEPYEASTHGRIRRNGRLLKLTPNVRSGYLYVMLSLPGRRKNALVHTLVLLTYRGPCPPGKEGRHFPDRDKANNRLTNLSYATHTVNMADQEIHKTKARGNRHGSHTMPGRTPRGDAHYTRRHPEKVSRGSARYNSKLSPEKYDEAVELLAQGMPQRKIGLRLGVTQSVISDIATNKRGR